MKANRLLYSVILASAAAVFLCAPATRSLLAQGAAQKPAEKGPAKIQEKAKEKPATKVPSKLPAEIELLETRIRFEKDGSSRKEVHALVKINDELGVRQFARLNFDFNRSFQQVEIPLVRVTHSGGGTADVLPSAITDTPNPAVVNAPAYQDVRVKSVRILGLEPSDSLEYRVITTTSHAPLAPDFWLEHTFDRTGVVSHEVFELDLPAPDVLDVKATGSAALRVNPATPITSVTKSGEGSLAHAEYHWEYHAPASQDGGPEKPENSEEPDVVYSTFSAWLRLSVRLAEKLLPGSVPLESLPTYEAQMQEMSRKPEVGPEIKAKAAKLTRESESGKSRLEALYDFVSQKITTVDLPLGATRFAIRPAKEILSTGYATQEDKFVLFAALASAVNLQAEPALTGYCDRNGLPRLSVFKRLLISVSDGKKKYWIDPSLEVAPFGLVPPNSGSCAFVLERFFYAMNSAGHEWEKLEAPLPFPAKQRVTIDATLSADGTLSARAKYLMRGDNELLLRVAFHQTPKENWKNVAQLLALSDGFRGQITNVTASDPYETHDPFTVEYEITQPKFVDWSKKAVRIPALLPLLGLPDPPAKRATGANASLIELGTPLDVEVSATVHLPPGTIARIPTGTSVERDFATYSSRYSAKDGTLTASRHLNFVLREIPADRSVDYNAFLQAVQNDESQVFHLERAEAKAAKPQKP